MINYNILLCTRAISVKCDNSQVQVARLLQLSIIKTRELLWTSVTVHARL